jgi:hypothetical protein
LSSKSKTAKLTADDVLEIARTGKDKQLGDVVITVDYVISSTSSKDWEGTLYALKPAAAYEIADSFNTSRV